jgi:hypothetical protein
MREFRLCGLVIFGMALTLCACPSRETPGKGNAPAVQATETSGDSRGPDPRAAFETSGILGGMSSLLESSVTLIAASGRPESGVSLALGGALSTAAVARRVEPSGADMGHGHELDLASGARASIPGPALAIASSGERIVVACADPFSPTGGALICFRTEGEGERLIVAWKKEGNAVGRLLAVPGGRIVASDDASSGASARIYLVDAVSGTELWAVTLSTAAADIAYAPGLVLAASGTRLDAYDESTGARLWSAALTAKARVLSAGNGVALVVAETGSLSAFSLGDGKGVGAAPGPFDPAIRPVADGARAIAATVNGGAAEIEVKSGRTLRSWAWTGPASFLAADRDRVYAGLDGLSGRGVYFAARAGEPGEKLLRLASGAFDSPIAVSGTRGGLLLLLMDGSLVLVGKDMASNATLSALDAAITPRPETVSAIASALGRFKPGDGADPNRYLRFDLFAQGMPVDTGVAFTAFRFEPASSARRTFSAQPKASGSVIAIYSEEGREMAASIDELGSVSSAAAYLEKGKRYWIVAGWIYQAEPERYRLFVK